MNKYKGTEVVYQVDICYEWLSHSVTQATGDSQQVILVP